MYTNHHVYQLHFLKWCTLSSLNKLLFHLLRLKSNQMSVLKPQSEHKSVGKELL